MHEMGITQSIIETAVEAAQEEGGTRINEIRITIGTLTEIVPDALQFAFEALRQGTMAEDATLIVTQLGAKSRCRECGAEFEHDKFDLTCPACYSFVCDLLQGRELRIDSLDIYRDDE